MSSTSKVSTRKLSSFIYMNGRRSSFERFQQQEVPIRSFAEKGHGGQYVSSISLNKSGGYSLERFLKIDCESGKVDINDANYFFDHMLRMAPSPPVSCFSTLLSALVKCKHFSLAISFYKTLDISDAIGLRSNLFILNILLNCYYKMRLGSAAFSVFGLVLKNGYRPSTATYNTLLKGLFSEDKGVEAHDLFLKMIRLGTAPNSITYNTVIDGLCKTGDVATALELHREMVHGKVSTTRLSLIDGRCVEMLPGKVGATKHNCKPETNRHVKWLTFDTKVKDTKISLDVVSYSSLINGLCRSGMEDDASFILAEMIDREVYPNVVTFSTIINSLCKKGKVEQTPGVLDTMRLRGEFPNTVTYNTMIDGWCRIGKIEEAMSLYKDMNCRGVFVDNATINPLLKGLFHLKKVEDAMSLFRNMKRMEANGTCGPDEVTYATIIDGLCKEGHIDVAEELFLEMQGDGLFVDVFVYGSLIDGLCKQGQIDKAEELISEMISSGVSPNVVVYNSLLNGLCKEGRLGKAKELFSQMQSSVIYPDGISYNSLLDGMYNFGNEEEAKMVLANMIVNGILPNVVPHSILEKWKSL